MQGDPSASPGPGPEPDPGPSAKCSRTRRVGAGPARDYTTSFLPDVDNEEKCGSLLQPQPPPQPQPRVGGVDGSSSSIKRCEGAGPGGAAPGAARAPGGPGGEAGAEGAKGSGELWMAVDPRLVARVRFEHGGGVVGVQATEEKVTETQVGGRLDAGRVRAWHHAR